MNNKLDLKWYGLSAYIIGILTVTRPLEYFPQVASLSWQSLAEWWALSDSPLEHTAKDPSAKDPRSYSGCVYPARGDARGIRFDKWCKCKTYSIQSDHWKLYTDRKRIYVKYLNIFNSNWSITVSSRSVQVIYGQSRF